MSEIMEKPPSSVCPICGVNTPHQHSGTEVAEHQVKVVMRGRLQWHLVNKHHATATGHNYYPSITTGEGVEVGYARGDVADTIIREHNRVVDSLLGFTSTDEPLTIHVRDQQQQLRGCTSSIFYLDDAAEWVVPKN